MFNLKCEKEFDGLYEHELTALRHAWTQLLDFAYSPYKPDFDEIHFYMQQMGKILGDCPPNALPFCGTDKTEEV